jgi:cytochrome c peroxidase
MHNGMFKTIRQVIDYYNDPDKIVSRSINRDTLLNTPMGLTEQEKTDLENFLISLTDKRFAAKLKNKGASNHLNRL